MPEFISLGPLAKDLAGQKFGRLTVLGPVERTGKSGKAKVIWLCRCACGHKIKVRAGHLMNGHVTSCGCYQRQISSMQSDAINVMTKKPKPENMADYFTWALDRPKNKLGPRRQRKSVGA